MSQTEEKLENNADKILAEAVRKSEMIEKDIVVNPKKYRVLTGDRPTGNLHIGHYFRSDYGFDCRLSGFDGSRRI